MAKSAKKTIDRDGETEQRILDAARAVFLRRGTAGARMQEIAQEAGVNQALLHYYFRSKEGLSTAVFQHIASRIFPALVQTLSADISIDEKIDRLVALYLDTLMRNPFLPGYLISELHHHPERVSQLLSSALGAAPGHVLPPLFEKLGVQINERVAAGEMRPIAPEQFAVNLISLCIFPFAARPMLHVVFGMDDAAFVRFIEQRKTELPAFFRNALRP
ncbi:MAG: TetR/AcrR family transcriptional regulator [Gemmatimonadaceae bacterium]